jgi:ankyrin repeat protein
MTAATLLGNGAEAMATGPEGVTALHLAAGRGSLALVEMLVRKGAPVSARDARGRTPESAAFEEGQRAVADLLAQHQRITRDCSDAASSRRAYDARGNRFRQPDLSRFDPALVSGTVGVSHGDLDEVRRRVEAQPEVACAIATTTEGAVEAGAHMGRKDIVDYLLDHGVPYSLPTAVMRNDGTRARELLAEEPSRIHERGAHDFALLWYPVIGGGHLELAEQLLDAGADVEQQHFLGTTALHWAALRGQLDMAALLLEHGADPDRPRRKFGAEPRTPLEHAVERGHDGVARLLRDRGARAAG